MPGFGEALLQAADSGSCCSLGDYALVGSALVSASVSTFARALSSADAVKLSGGRILQQVYNLQRATVRLPTNLSTTGEGSVCYYNGGAAGGHLTCIENGCARITDGRALSALLSGGSLISLRRSLSKRVDALFLRPL